MKVTSGISGSHSGAGLLRITVLVSLTLGIALAVLLTPGSVAADWQDELIVPIVLEEGRTPPNVVEPPIVVEETRDEPRLVQRDVQGRGVTVTQTSTTLVSNTGQANATNFSFTVDRALPFTTGSNAAGYTLTRIDMNMRATSGQPSFSVNITEDSSGLPGSSLGTLKNPTLGSSFGTVQFSASGDGIDLDATSTYWMIINVHTSITTSHIRATISDAEDSGAASGWEIGNNQRVRGHLQSTWVGSGSSAEVAKMKVVGYANSNEPAVLANGEVSGATLVLTFDSKLDTTSVPAASRFTIEAGGSSYTASGISISGRQVTLTVPSVKEGQFVTVSYRRSGSNPLKGNNGKAVATFSNKAVTNNTPSSQDIGPVRGAITYTEGGETVEVQAYSADRDTLYNFFVQSCTRVRSATSLHDYSWFNADGLRMMARNGWKYVEVQNANGDVTGTRPMTISECANHGMYQRRAFCENYTTGQLAVGNEDNVCPDDRSW